MYRPYTSSLADSRSFLDVESLLRNLGQDFVTSFNTGNYDQVAALFAQDGVLMAPHHDPASVSYTHLDVYKRQATSTPQGFKIPIASATFPGLSPPASTNCPNRLISSTV